MDAERLVTALLDARRKPKKAAAPEPSPEQMSDFIMQSFTQGPMLRLLALAEQYNISISGKVERTSHHYVHQRSTSFTLYVEYTQDVPPEVEAWVDENTNGIEAEIGEKIIEINHKIYRALEREWDYRNKDETVDEDIRANDYDFDQDGNREEGTGIKFDQLGDRAKITARDWFRQGNTDDNFWSEHIIEEWTSELKKMGFGSPVQPSFHQSNSQSDPEISWSGFWTQGDGASFTTKHFDFEEYVNYFLTGQDKEEGPMSDEERAAQRRADGLPESEEEIDDQISRMIRAQEAEEDSLMQRITSRTMADTFPYETFMHDISLRYMSGLRQFNWNTENSWFHLRVYVSLFKEDSQPWEISISVRDIETTQTWRLDHRMSEQSEKAELGPRSHELVERLKVITEEYRPRPNLGTARRQQEFLNYVAGEFNRIFRSMTAFEET